MFLIYKKNFPGILGFNHELKGVNYVFKNPGHDSWYQSGQPAIHIQSHWHHALIQKVDSNLEQ